MALRFDAHTRAGQPVGAIQSDWGNGLGVGQKLRQTPRMKITSSLKVAALSACALLSACAERGGNSVATTAAPKPGLWKLADADTTIYLFGTVHVLPKNFAWRSPRIDAAIESADTLVLEIADSGDDAKTAATFTNLAISPGLPPVADRVPSDRRAKLDGLIAKVGIPAPALQSFESWAVAITLAAGMLAEMGISPDDGVETQLTADFKRLKRPISGLETTPEQLGFFDTLSEESQRTFLISMVDEAANAKTEFDQMIAAWASGDDKAIAITFDDEMRLSAEMADVLLRQRNARWTDWVAKRLDQPGTVFVAVGAGHLAGDDSVQAMLAKKGLKVSRVQ
jgi:uncharacterized protein